MVDFASGVGAGFVDAAGMACSGRWLAQVARFEGKLLGALAAMAGYSGSSEMVA